MKIYESKEHEAYYLLSKSLVNLMEAEQVLQSEHPQYNEIYGIDILLNQAICKFHPYFESKEKSLLLQQAITMRQ